MTTVYACEVQEGIVFIHPDREESVIVETFDFDRACEVVINHFTNETLDFVLTDSNEETAIYKWGYVGGFERR